MKSGSSDGAIFVFDLVELVRFFARLAGFAAGAAEAIADYEARYRDYFARNNARRGGFQSREAHIEARPIQKRPR